MSEKENIDNAPQSKSSENSGAGEAVDISGGGCLKLLLVPLILLIDAVLLWAFLTPGVRVYYPADGEAEMRYIWDVQYRIYKGRMLPGSVTTDWAPIFRDDDFFMMFDWRIDGKRRQCVSITPKWRSVDIYLDKDGDIDRSSSGGTDVESLSPCPSY